MPALGVAVHDVVVQQREVVHELDGRGGGHAALRRGAGGAGRQQRERRAQRLARGAAGRLAARSRPGRGGRRRRCATAGLSRPTAAAIAGPTRSRAVSTPAGIVTVMTRSRDRASSRRAAPGRPRPAWPARWISSCAAVRPLRTAPSIVSGQPVSVHAPASSSPGTEVAAPGRSAPAPGACRNVARRSLVTKKSVTRGPAAAGNSCSSAGRNAPAAPRSGRPRSSSAADSDTARYCPVGRPAVAGLVEHPLHRRIHRGGERQLGDLPVVDHVHVDDRRRAQVMPSAAAPRDAGRPGQPGGLARGHGQHHAVGRDQLGARGGVTGAVRAATSARPGTRRPAALDRAPPWRPAAPARRAGRAGGPRRRPCRSPSGTVGTPMSAASCRPSSAVLITVAASATLASSPSMFSDEMMNRSQSRRRARSSWPRAASQFPSRCPSRPGWAGSANRKARAARAHPEPLGQREQAVAEQSPGQVQRARQRAAAQPGPAAGRQHGDVEAVLERDRAGHAEPAEQLLVAGAAAQEHVLAVVDRQPAAGERASRRRAAAGPRAA